MALNTTKYSQCHCTEKTKQTSWLTQYFNCNSRFATLISLEIYLYIPNIFFKIYFVDQAITVVPFFSPFYFLTPFLPSFPYLSSCPWVIHISSLASPFPILFLTSPCLFSTYHLCFLFPIPFPNSLSLLITLHVISISVNLFLFQLFAQFIFVFVFVGTVVDSLNLLSFYCSWFFLMLILFYCLYF